MRFIPALVLAGTLLLSLAGGAGAQQVVESLRGDVPITDEARTDNMFRPEKDQASIPRNYPNQPPLIPHSIKGYNITQNFNKCMDCRSKDRAKETGATPVGKSHYVDRDAHRLENISPRRYFCMQCHVPQFDAKPLVGNTFKPAAKKGE